MPSAEDLPQAYCALQQRFQRTTNALGSAAHDLKTPLAILNGYVELLQSEKLGPISERQREVLGDMQASGKRLSQFIQDFLTFSALETGGLKMQFALGNINQCLSEVCRMWSMRFQERGLALRYTETGAGDFESAGKFLQVCAAGWNGVDPRRAVHVGTAGEFARCGIDGPQAAEHVAAELGEDQRGRHWARHSGGVSSGGVRRFLPAAGE
jgi:signal transduction histidine kinase